jgi:hypothetical protein
MTSDPTTRFPIVDVRRTYANENLQRSILDCFGPIEPYSPESDSWVVMPVRLVHHAAGGFRLEIGQYDFGHKEIDTLRKAIAAYDQAVGRIPHDELQSRRRKRNAATTR